MRKEIWFIHRLGPIEVLAAIILIAGIATISGVWVTTAAKQVYAHPMDSLPYTILVLALYIAFNGLIIGVCCAAVTYIVKFICVVARRLYRFLRGVSAQPIHLARLVTASLSICPRTLRSIRQRLLR